MIPLNREGYGRCHCTWVKGGSKRDFSTAHVGCLYDKTVIGCPQVKEKRLTAVILTGIIYRLAFESDTKRRLRLFFPIYVGVLVKSKSHYGTLVIYNTLTSLKAVVSLSFGPTLRLSLPLALALALPLLLLLESPHESICWSWLISLSLMSFSPISQVLDEVLQNTQNGFQTPETRSQGTDTPAFTPHYTSSHDRWDEKCRSK